MTLGASEDAPGAVDRKAEDEPIVGPLAEDDNAASGRYGCAAAWSGLCDTPLEGGDRELWVGEPKRAQRLRTHS